MATIKNLDQEVTYKSSLKGLMLMNRVITIAQKARDFNPNPVELKEQLAELEPNELMELRENLEKLIANHQIVNL